MHTVSLDDASKKAHVPKKPAGLEPSFKIGSKARKGSGSIRGVISSGERDTPPTRTEWVELLKELNGNPAVHHIDPTSVTLEVKTAIKDGVAVTSKSWRADVFTLWNDILDIDKFAGQYAKLKPSKIELSNEKTKRSIMALMADTQIGKGEGGGTDATIERIQRAQDEFIEYAKYLIKVGRRPESIWLMGMGDIIENFAGYYAQQLFTTDRNFHEQMEIAVRLIMRFINLCVDKLDVPINVGAVPGNHGEVRADGKSVTNFDDNADVQVFRYVAFACAQNPERYAKRVTFHNLSEDERQDMTFTTAISGVLCGFAHGHQFAHGGTESTQRIHSWWKNQWTGRNEIGNAQILFTAHYHHFVASEQERQVFQCPAMDGGSEWFQQRSGKSADPGMLVLGIGTGYGSRGWGDLNIFL